MCVTQPHVHNDTISCLDKLAIFLEEEIQRRTLMRTEHVNGQKKLIIGKQESIVMEN